MTKRARLVASAATLFAIGAVAATAGAEGTIKCSGINSCKGMGWTQTSSASECTAKGGKVI